MVMNEQIEDAKSVDDVAIGEEGNRFLLKSYLSDNHIYQWCLAKKMPYVNVSNRFERWSIGLPDRFTDESWSSRSKGDRIFRYVAQMTERLFIGATRKMHLALL